MVNAMLALCDTVLRLSLLLLLLDGQQKFNTVFKRTSRAMCSRGFSVVSSFIVNNHIEYLISFT